MSEAWAICMPAEKLAVSGALRLRPGILAAIIDGAAWLRGAELTEELDHALRLLPAAVRYNLVAGGTLISPGARLPIGRLPELEWEPLADLLVFQSQPPALPGQLGQKVPLRLERGGAEKAASVLIAAFADWARYALSAPLVRLRPLSFAVSDFGRTVIRGTPLPPIAGERYVEDQGIATPCGWRMVPEIDPPTLHAILNTQPADLVLFDQDGSWELISADDFVSADRANVRATAESLKSA